MSGIPADIGTAIEQLYDAFAGRPRRARIEFCGHCVSPQEAEALVGAELREIGPDLLSVFVLNAMAETWGDWDDLCAYLPRVLELVAAGGLSSCDICGLFFGLGVHWREWPADQQQALTGYLMALWRATLAGYSHPCSLDAIDILQAAGELGASVTPYVREWQTRGGETPALRLAWLIGNADRWDGPYAEWGRALDEWVSGPAARRVLRVALAQASSPEVAANLTAALAALDRWSAAGA